MVILAFYKVEYGQLQEMATAFGVRALGIWPRLCAFASLREIGFLVQAAVLAKAQRRKGREGRRACYGAT
jgi:hypothetical protein